MILLACADQKSISRWKRGLFDYENLSEVNHFTDLRKKLRIDSNATVILHYSLPGLTNVEDIRVILSDYPQTRLLILADVPDEHQGIELIRTGVLGYANTHIKPEILHEAIKVIELGEIWVSKRLLQWLVSHCNEPEATTDETGSFLALDALTPSERHVIKHLSKGANNKDIARQLNITERTVKAHLTSIYNKTGVKDRLHLALLVNGTKMANVI